MSQVSMRTSAVIIGAVQTLTGNTGGAVPPTGGNINVIGAETITVAGNPGTSTLTITSDALTASVQTVDATPTALYSLTLADETAVTLIATVVGATADYASCIGGQVIGTFSQVALSTPTEITDIDNTMKNAGAGVSVQFVVNGANIELTVVGQAATIYNWVATIQRKFLTA